MTEMEIARMGLAVFSFALAAFMACVAEKLHWKWTVAEERLRHWKVMYEILKDKYDRLQVELTQTQRARDAHRKSAEGWSARVERFEAEAKRLAAEMLELQRLLGIDGRAQIGWGDGEGKAEAGVRAVQEGGAEDLVRPAVRAVPGGGDAGDQAGLRPASP